MNGSIQRPSVAQHGNPKVSFYMDICVETLIMKHASVVLHVNFFNDE